MKWILILALSLASALSIAGDRGDRMARMQEHLGLSDAQIEHIRGIRKNGGSREDMRAVLTDDQRTTMDQHHRNRKNHGGDQRGRPPANGERPPRPGEGG